MSSSIVIASGNRGKLAEFNALFQPWSLKVEPQSAYDVPEAIEDSLSFIENAIIKARNAAQHSGLPAIADDSGLEVDALQGQPGIYSARFSADLHGDQANDDTNNKKLLSLLENIDQPQRTARFVCALAFLRHSQDPNPVISVASWQGRILREPRGDNGFGYDPLFYLPELDCTSAELEPAQKNRLSHRGQAMAGLLTQLKSAGIIS